MILFRYPFRIQFPVFFLGLACSLLLIYMATKIYTMDRLLFMVFGGGTVFFVWTYINLIAKYSDVGLSDFGVERFFFGKNISKFPWCDIKSITIDERSFSFLREGGQKVCIMKSRNFLLFAGVLHFDDFLCNFDSAVNNINLFYRNGQINREA